MKDVRIRVAAIIVNDNDEVLLIAHKKEGNIYWLLPGGGVDYGEPLTEALQRELKEELNIAIDVGEPAILFDSIDPSGKRHIVNIYFKCSYKDGDYVLGSDKRLYDFSYVKSDDLLSLKMYPPINKELYGLLHNKNNKLYMGNIWLEK